MEIEGVFSFSFFRVEFEWNDGENVDMSFVCCALVYVYFSTLML